ncbi:unnamed protein product [Meloidogyne enterolobii]|uniref:Uncharacterized protein n=1 Tax=Meloidogyne enterolobii TaxID=390850 RepID=A0ACB1AYT4_MELEN
MPNFPLIFLIFIFSIFHFIPLKSQLLIHSTHQPRSLISSNSRFRQCACPTRQSSPLSGSKAKAAPKQKFLPKMLQGTSTDMLFDKNLVDGFLTPLNPNKEEKKRKGTGRSGREWRPKREANKIVDLALADPEKNKCNSERLRQIILKAKLILFYLFLSPRESLGGQGVKNRPN